MAQCFDIDKKELGLVKDTQFVNVREVVCQQATLYNAVIAPFGQSILEETLIFFQGFENFTEIDDLKDSINDLCIDSQLIVQGFDICKKIHQPILTQAEVNKLKAKAVSDEIASKEDGLNDQFD